MRLWESSSFRERAQPLGKPRLHPCPVNSSLPQHFMVMGFKLCQPKWKGMQQTMGEAAL